MFLDFKWNDIREIYIVGRISSFIFNIITCILLFKIYKRFGLHNYLSLFCLSIFIIHIPEHSLAARPDAMKDFFFTLLIFHCFKHLENTSTFSTITLTGISLLGIFTKQDIFIYIFIFFISIYLNGFNKKWLSVLLLVVTCTILSSLCLNYLTNGYFYQNAIGGNVEYSDDFLIRWLRDMSKVMLSASIPLVFLMTVWLKSKKDSKMNILIFNCALSFLAAAITSIKFGAASNYYTPFFLWLSICIAYSFKASDLLLSKTTNSWLIPSLAVIFFLAQGKSSLATINHNESKSKEIFYHKKKVANLIIKKYNGERLIIFDERLVVFMPYDMVFKGFNMFFDDWFYARHGFVMNDEITLYEKPIENEKRMLLGQLDLLILENNYNNIDLYKAKYSNFFVFKESIYEYNIYERR